MLLFDKNIYQQRRDALRSALKGGIILLPGNSESPANYPCNAFRFRQDSTFLYFFGLNHPDYAGLIDLDSGEEFLFGNDYSLDDIIWTGPQPSLAEQGTWVGIRNTEPLNSLHQRIDTALQQRRKIRILPPYRGETILQLCDLLHGSPEQIGTYVCDELAKTVVALREIKAPYEVEQIEQASGISSLMHLQAMQMCRTGVVEREIVGAIEGIALQHGAGVAFPSIVTQHGETLHNHNYCGTLQKGRLMLVDAGAEALTNYCSDLTRTIPVGGHFSPQQKEIYDIVERANRRIFELAGPETFYCQMHNQAALIIAEGLKALGLMQGDMQEAVAAGAQALFMPHGLGHQMGLDVHDMESIGEKYVGYDQETLRSSTPGLSSLRIGKRLREGFVITVEPGIYFIPALIAKWKREKLGEGFIHFDRVEKYLDFGGIRIEDNMLITATGNRMLGKNRPPVTTQEIEAYMNQ